MGVVFKMGLSWKLPDTLQYERLQKYCLASSPRMPRRPPRSPPRLLGQLDQSKWAKWQVRSFGYWGTIPLVA